jgi:glucose-1-phosphate adenylyltransferase
MNTASMSSLPGTQAFVLAGGQGERLFPLTVSRPKPAIPFGGVFRIIDFALYNCLNSNLSEVALLTQYRHEELHSYIRQRWAEFWNVPGTNQKLLCLPPVSGKRYRGTADAVFQNLSLIDANAAEYVLILSGDHIYEMDYRELLSQHVESGADVTIATLDHPLNKAAQFGVVEVDGNFRVTGFEEKPLNPRPLPMRPQMALISMGVYVFNRDVLVRALRENCDNAFGFDFGHHVIPSLIDSSRVYAFDFRDDAQSTPRYWRDIGTLDSYYDASMDLVPQHTPLNVGRSLTCHASVSGSARVARSVLSAGIRIEEGASVEDCVLMPEACIGRGAQLRRAIIEEGVRIPDGFQVGLDHDYDRKHHTVSRNGVVVVCDSPKIAKTPAVSFSNVQPFRSAQAVAM